MKKRIFILNLLLAILICLSGCGSEEEKTVMTQGGGSSSGSSDFMDSSRSYIDYSDVAIAGGLTDYSYVFSAEAYVDSKAPINDFYNELEKYILSKNGYIEKMNTDYSTYDKPNFKGMSYAQKQYAIKAIENKAYGYCNFTIQIDEDYSDTVIYRLNEFCNSNNFTVKEYMKNGTNYQAYLVVADFETTNKDKKQITRQDLEQRL